MSCYVNNYYLFIEIVKLFNRVMHSAISAYKIIRSGFSRFHGQLKNFAYEQTIQNKNHSTYANIFMFAKDYFAYFRVSKFLEVSFIYFF